MKFEGVDISERTLAWAAEFLDIEELTKEESSNDFYDAAWVARTALEEARMWLGWELDRIREEESNPQHKTQSMPNKENLNNFLGAGDVPGVK